MAIDNQKAQDATSCASAHYMNIISSAALVQIYVLAYPAGDSPLNSQYRPVRWFKLKGERVITPDTDITRGGQDYRNHEHLIRVQQIIAIDGAEP